MMQMYHKISADEEVAEYTKLRDRAQRRSGLKTHDFAELQQQIRQGNMGFEDAARIIMFIADSARAAAKKGR